MYFRSTYLTLFFIIQQLCINLYAQNTYTISNFTVDDGLAQSSVYSICQDSRGFLWFATNGGGVSRYDGINFESFTTKDGLAANKVYAIIEDDKGNIWMGGRDGITVYDGYKFINYTTSNGLSSNDVSVIKQGKDNDIWIGTNGAGIMKYNGKTFSKYNVENGLLSNNVYDIEVLSEGEILFATKDGISKFDGKRFVMFDADEYNQKNAIRSVIELSENEVWYGSYGGGICKVKNGKHIDFTLRIDDESQNVMDILQSRNGDIWVGTFGDGLFCVKKDTILHFATDNSTISSNSIISLYEDAIGNIWAGTFLGGVCKINEASFYSITEKNGLENPSIENLYEGEKGIYMSSMSGDLDLYKDGKIYSLPTAYKQKSTRITSFLKDNEGHFWVSTDGSGLYHFDKEGMIGEYHKGASFPSNQVFSIYQTKDSTYWFGSYGDGIIKMKNGEVKTFDKNYVRGLESNQILDIEEAENGYLWFATNGGGISSFDGKNFTSYTKKDGLLSNDFVSIQKDMFANLWFASNGGGIVKYDGVSFKTYSTKDGLISDNVNLILFDNANNLWVGTEKGINKIIFELKDTLGKIDYIVNNVQQYGLEEGLVGLEINRGASLKDKKGNLWFGTVKGVSVYNPKADKFNLVTPNVFIKSIQLDNKIVDWSIYTDSITKWNNIPKNLSLPHNKNNLTFNYVGINLNVPHGVEYRYILEGLETEWTSSKNTSVAYSNLSSGDYVFKVLAANEDGMWQREPTEFKFSVDSPFWFKWWFILISISLIVITIVYYIKSRERAIRIQNIALEKIVGERTAELKREKKNIERINQEIEKKNEQVLDSIQYAKRIQMAILPPDELVREKLPEYGIFYEAKDIVSGDFYWMTEEQDLLYFAAVDCTGHGVPGAFMSIVGYRLLELIINGYSITEPAHVLDELHMQVLETLHKQKGKDISDGMDIALCCWDKKTSVLKYAGAHNPLYLIRDGELTQYNSDNRPIGMSMIKKFGHFNQQEIEIKRGDIVYIFTDGFADQFGGEKFRKYYYQNFQQFLLSISDKTMEEQQHLLREEFYAWKGTNEQIDDVLVFGVKF